jgi:hypothetical protein
MKVDGQVWNLYPICIINKYFSAINELLIFQNIMSYITALNEQNWKEARASFN